MRLAVVQLGAVKHFGNFVRDARVKLGWAQEDLARASDLARNTIWNIENSPTVPTRLMTLAALAKGLGMSMDDLRAAADSHVPYQPPDPLSAALASAVPGLSGSDLDTVARLALLALAPRQRLVLLGRWAKSGGKPADLIELARNGQLLEEEQPRLTGMRMAASTGIPKPPKPPKHKPEGGT